MTYQELETDTPKPVFSWAGHDLAQAETKMAKNVASLPFVFKHVALMPDVHLGKGALVGSVIATKNAIIPAAVGVDIGCGMIAIQTPFTSEKLDGKLKKIRLDLEAQIPVGFEENKQGNAASFCSCSHGAGRIMSRFSCREAPPTMAKNTYTLDDLIAQTAGVECRKDAELLDEIPAAYKSIDTVMANQSDLVEVIATMKQVVCIKG